MSKTFRACGALVPFVLLSPLFLNAQEIANRPEPMDVFRVQVASDPQISPDGTRIVYVRQSADIGADRRVANLWIVDFDGSEHRPLTAGTVGDSSRNAASRPSIDQRFAALCRQLPIFNR